MPLTYETYFVKKSHNCCVNVQIIAVWTQEEAILFIKRYFALVLIAKIAPLVVKTSFVFDILPWAAYF